MADDEHTDSIRSLLAGVSARITLFRENAEQCLGQLDDRQIWFRRSPRENAIGNLVLHIVGSTDQIIHAIERQPDTRNRPTEFSVTGGRSRDELSACLRATLDRCCLLIDSLPPTRLADPYPIQGRDTTVAYALIMAVSHLGLHLGQVQFIAKSLLQDRYREVVRRAPK